MAVEQLEFFPKTDEERNAERIEEVFKRLENIRKGMFQRLNIAGKEILALHERIEILERYICSMKPKAKQNEFKFDVGE